jgi:hypothetical protein
MLTRKQVKLHVCSIPISISTGHSPTCTKSHPIKKVQSKAFLVQALNAYRGSRGITPLILSLGTRWMSVVNITPRPLYPQERTLLQIEYEAGWAPEPVWTFRRGEKALVPTGIRTPDIPHESKPFQCCRSIKLQGVLL